MLAREFLPAANLKITEKQKAALVAVLLKFEGGEVEHRRLMPTDFRRLRPGEQRGFNMLEWDCGTACCIGGWADAIGGASFDTMLRIPPMLDRLFYPATHYPKAHGRMQDITVAQAVTALRSYLTNGDPAWETIL